MMRSLLILFLFGQTWSKDVERVTVVTSKGPIIGQKATDGNYTTFFGIPYAKVDEENPFGASLDYSKFESPFDASNSSIKCPQAFTNEGILQCLRLNIYTPNSASKQKLPVLVWIHGGGFTFGSAGDYGGKYLVEKDVILVTINYRLGSLGFLTTNDPEVPGNQGLKDQNTALKWINQNIGAFGGNPDKVTIAGESYGGGSVDFHLYSLEDKLFKQAIIQSGSIYTQGAFVESDYDAAKKLAKQLGFNTTSTQEALKFLSRANPIEVMKAQQSIGLKLGVCKEKEHKGVRNFLTKDVKDLTSSDVVKNISIMIGYNSKEMFDIFYNKSDEFYAKLKYTVKESLSNSFNHLSALQLDKLSETVKAFYFGSKPIDRNAYLELTDFTGDWFLNRAAERSVSNYKLNTANVYKYLFSYTGSSPFKDVPSVGAFHTEELQYLFDVSGPLKSDEPISTLIRNRLIVLWTNFVKHGNPTPQVTDLLPVTWSPVHGQESKPCLNIDKEMEMLTYVNKERVAFWDIIWEYNSLVHRA